MIPPGLADAIDTFTTALFMPWLVGILLLSGLWLTVRTGAVQDGLWLVSEGLKDGDRVIVDGFQKFVPGDKVNAKAWIDADASVGTIPGAPPAQASR